MLAKALEKRVNITLYQQTSVDVVISRFHSDPEAKIYILITHTHL